MSVDSSRETYLEAAEAFADQVAALSLPLDGRPGLGEWDLRALVGHASRSLVTVSTYLAQPVDTVVRETAADYYAAINEAGFDPGEVLERGVQAGLVLGDDPAGVVRRLVETVADDLVGVDLALVITTIMGGMRVRDYLPTRTFELVVHGLDIAAATGTDWTPPPAALAEATRLTADIAVAGGIAADFLKVVTGRSGTGFTIV